MVSFQMQQKNIIKKKLENKVKKRGAVTNQENKKKP